MKKILLFLVLFLLIGAGCSINFGTDDSNNARELKQKGTQPEAMKQIEEVEQLDKTSIPKPQPKLVEDHTAEIESISIFTQELAKSSTVVESSSPYIELAKEYLSRTIPPFSSTMDAFEAAEPIVQQAHDIVLSTSEPDIPSEECCSSMTPTQIKQWYLDKYSCQSQWITLMKQLIVAHLNVVRYMSDEAIATQNSVSEIAEAKTIECNGINAQETSVKQNITDMINYKKKLESQNK